VTSLETVRAAHPDWTIRHDAGPDWSAYTAQRVQVVVTSTLDELSARLGGDTAADPRVIAAAELLAERHQPITMTPGDLRQLLARYQRRLHELLEAFGPNVREAGS
jgi:hypothetical protein